MMFGRGYFVNNGCFGYGFFNTGWHMLITIGILLVIVAVTYSLIKKSKKSALNNSSLESLKMKYVQGEITEEEYLNRKKVLNRK
ncbi:MAG: hypothetical protein COA82_06420 [Alkaliphilus sp.]|nr:SHOCT domain-containing protein [bacterium AH-315-L21]MBN4069276.1 SHOCT domain-containing protein [bacterium AH-315-G05]PHS34863.1 MAG: hypothetical protein COA82_06420 [Alkaliphilus sp.]